MKWTSFAVASSLAGVVSAQSDTVAYTDAETGIQFQSFTDADSTISWRVAIPEQTDGDYDAIIQIEGPSTLGWIGWAWGGTMAYNPLTVIWPNGNEIVCSPRIAYGFFSPSVYDGSSYQVLKGTGIANGRLKFTAVCKGCTTWEGSDGNPQALDLTQPARLAFTLSHTPVDTPSNSSSTFAIHDNVGYWNADLAASKSANFSTWVEMNTAPAANGTIQALLRPIMGLRVGL